MRIDLPTTRAVGAAIRDARLKAGLTQAELAQRVDTSREWVVRLERGSREGTELGLVLRVLRELGLSLTIEPRPTPTNPAAAAALEALRAEASR